MNAAATTATFPLGRLIRLALRGHQHKLHLATEVAKHADIVRLPLPGRPRMVITHPADLKHVLATHRDRYKKSYDYQVLRQLMGNGLVTSEDPKWGSDRALLNPSFTKATAETFRAAMTEHAEALASEWRDRGEHDVDVFATMMRLTIALIGRRMFAADISDQAEKIRVLINQLAWHVFSRSQAVVDWARFVATPAELSARRAKKDLLELLMQHLQDCPADSVAGVLKADGRSVQDMLDHVITLFVAGYDTTGHAMGWCLYTLAQQAELQERVVQRMADPSTLYNLVQETVRCFPTVPGAGREALVDDELRGVPVKKGTNLLLFIYGTHRRADLWPDADVFDPDRWQRENKAQVPYAYVPFGGGPRLCIGSHLATLEMIATFAVLLPRFRFSIPPGAAPIVPIPGISLSPSAPTLLRVTPR